MGANENRRRRGSGNFILRVSDTANIVFAQLPGFDAQPLLLGFPVGK